MESQQIMQFLLALPEDTKATQAKADARHEEARSNQANTDAALQVMQEKAEIGHKELLTRLESDRQTEWKELKEMMEGTMQANQTKTDAKLEDLMERIEKTQIELHTAEMCHDATTKKFQEDLTKTYNKTCKRIEETKHEFPRPGLTRQIRRGSRGQTHQQSAWA
jgi:hypothetical protein